MNSIICGNTIYKVTILYEILKEKTSEKVLSLLKELDILNVQRQFHYTTDETNKDKIKSEINDCINKNLLIYKTPGGFCYKFKEIISIKAIT